MEGIARALVNIYKGNVDIDHEVEEHLFQETSKIFNEAISEGYANAVENNTPLPNDTFRSSFKNRELPRTQVLQGRSDHTRSCGNRCIGIPRL